MTTRFRDPASRASHGPRTRPADAAPLTVRQAQLLIDYLAEVEEARQREARALARLRSALLAGSTAELHSAFPGSDGTPVRRRGRRAPRSPHQQAAQHAVDWVLRQPPRVLLVAGLVLMAFVVAAARGGDDDVASTAAGGAHAGHAGHGAQQPARLAPGSDIKVELGEFFIKADYDKVRADTITFDVTNTGDAEHELMVADLDVLTEQQISSMTSHEVHDRVLGAAHGLTAGTDGRLVLDLEPGRYILFCNLPGHFAQGQHMTFRVA